MRLELFNTLLTIIIHDIEDAMKLYQLKKMFTDHFNLVANAANARKVLKNEGKKIPRSDFRCTKTWQQLLDCFNILKVVYELEQRRQQRRRATVTRSPKTPQEESFLTDLAVKSDAYLEAMLQEIEGYTDEQLLAEIQSCK